MKKNFVNYICIVVVILLSVLTIWSFYGKQDAIHIAMVGPESNRVGRYFRQGVDLCLDKINREGGIRGKKIVLDVFDDQNNSDRAREEAIKIRDENQVVAIIGHHYSSCSIEAGEIYKNSGIPAISPASTNVNVTKDNRWYFRSSFNDNRQGRFLVTYAKEVLKQNTISIISHDKPYGKYLSKIFRETAEKIGVEVKHEWSFEMNEGSPETDPEKIKKNEESLERELENIVSKLQKEKDAGAIFLATHAKEGALLVKKNEGSPRQKPHHGSGCLCLGILSECLSK